MSDKITIELTPEEAAFAALVIGSIVDPYSGGKSATIYGKIKKELGFLAISCQ